MVVTVVVTMVNYASYKLITGLCHSLMVDKLNGGTICQTHVGSCSSPPLYLTIVDKLCKYNGGNYGELAIVEVNGS